MTKDQQQQQTVDDDQVPGLVGDDHTTLVDLRLQRATQMLHAALQIKDTNAFANAATAALLEADHSLDAIWTTKAEIQGKPLVPSAQMMYLAVADVMNRSWDATKKTRRPEPLSTLHTLGRDLSSRTYTTFGSLGMKPFYTRDAVEFADEVAARADGAKNGLDTLSVAEKATLGRMFIRTSEQLVLDGWSHIIEGRGEGALLQADANLREAVATLLDPNVIAHSGELAEDITKLEAVIGRFVAHYRESKPHQYKSLGSSIGRHVDRLREYLYPDAKPRWEAAILSAP